MKVTFDTRSDTLEEVLQAVRAGYGVALAVAEASDALPSHEPTTADINGAALEEPAAPEEAEPQVRTLTPVDEQSLETAEEPVAGASSRATARTRSPRSAVRQSAAKTAVKKPTPKTATAAVAKKATAKKSPAKEPAGPRPRAGAKEPTASPGKQGLNGRARKGSNVLKKPDAATVRSWAREQGVVNVSTRGKLSASLYEAYAAAHR